MDSITLKIGSQSQTGRAGSLETPPLKPGPGNWPAREKIVCRKRQFEEAGLTCYILGHRYWNSDYVRTPPPQAVPRPFTRVTCYTVLQAGILRKDDHATRCFEPTEMNISRRWAISKRNTNRFFLFPLMHEPEESGLHPASCLLQS